MGLVAYDYRLDNLDPTSGRYELPLNSVTIMQVLLYAALLCSSDVVSAVSIVDYAQ